MKEKLNVIVPGTLVIVDTWTMPTRVRPGVRPLGFNSLNKQDIVLVIAGPFLRNYDQNISNTTSVELKWLMMTTMGKMYWENARFLESPSIRVIGK